MIYFRSKLDVHEARRLAMIKNGGSKVYISCIFFVVDENGVRTGERDYTWHRGTSS